MGELSLSHTATLSVTQVMEKMNRAVIFLLQLAFTFLSVSQAKSIIPQPHALNSFEINSTQHVGSCSYTVTIRTSCSSSVYTRDQISLTFGDAYGNQVYAPRIDDPYSRTFERCSTDTFQISGPCTYQICYVYLYRNGYDGWKPESLTFYGYYTKSVTFYYNTFIPNGVWYGFNRCYAASDPSTSAM